jgi:hypothetical protein
VSCEVPINRDTKFDMHTRKAEFNHEGHEVHEVKNCFVFCFFVSFVSFVVLYVFVPLSVQKENPITHSGWNEFWRV